METIVERTGDTEREPMITDAVHMDAKLERSSTGVYFLVFTGTNEDGDRYCAKVLPPSVDIFLASEHEKLEMKHNVPPNN